MTTHEDVTNEILALRIDEFSPLEALTELYALRRLANAAEADAKAAALDAAHAGRDAGSETEGGK